jgi:hypothetical protein
MTMMMMTTMTTTMINPMPDGRVRLSLFRNGPCREECLALALLTLPKEEDD